MSGKGLTEQPGVSRMTKMAQNGHEGDYQSVAGQAVQSISSFQEGTEKPKGMKWLKVFPSSKEGVELPGRLRTTIRAPSNEDSEEAAK